MAVTDDLLGPVKNYLDITWNDTELDKKLSGIISRGIKYIDKIAGAAMDYTIEDKPRELLMDYCRYVRANALDKFQNNYLHELLGLQNSVETAEYISKTNLLSLTIGALVLSPAFSASVKAYSAITVNDSDIITATAFDPAATITITNGIVHISSGSAALWVTGTNVITITVKYSDRAAVYTITVTR